jgi:3',5'-cyclic AMP phosphodiesterase CpdA
MPPETDVNTDATYVEIIHLSDLHYGEGHIFNMDRTADGSAPASKGMPTLAEMVIRDLEDPSQEPARPFIGESMEVGASGLPSFDIPPMPKIVCLSGDFTQKASLEEFQQAETLIGQLQKSLKLAADGEGIYLCPGNHDLNWRSEDDTKRWDQYANFLTRITNRVHRAQEAALFGGVQVCTAAKTIVLSLNSEMKVLDEDGERSRGDLHPTQLAWARQQLEQLELRNPDAYRDYIKIAMVHHHPVLLPSSAEAGRGYDAITGANKLLPMLHDHGFHVVLHGHKHYPHTFREDIRNAFVQAQDHSLFIVAGGTCGSKELPTPRIATQCYNRIRIHWSASNQTTRVQVITRGLVKYKDTGAELMEDQWYWKTLAVDDRHHIARQRPTLPSAAGLRYMPRVAPNSPVNLARDAEYARTRGYFPVAEILPAMLPGQTLEVHLRIVAHESNQPRNSEHLLVAVTWSGGDRWFPSVNVTRSDDPDFSTVFAYWGGALLQAELYFANGTSCITHVYVPTLDSYAAQPTSAATEHTRDSAKT